MPVGRAVDGLRLLGAAEQAGVPNLKHEPRLGGGTRAIVEAAVWITEQHRASRARKPLNAVGLEVPENVVVAHASACVFQEADESGGPVARDERKRPCGLIHVLDQQKKTELRVMIHVAVKTLRVLLF